jgi:enediyne biosynthesis protein E4
MTTADAIGAEVMIQAGDQNYWRSVSPHESYASSNDPRVHCGLGMVDEVRQIQVTWPDGQVRVFENLSADRFYEVRRDAITPLSTSNP